jgi:hypothetical protein
MAVTCCLFNAITAASNLKAVAAKIARISFIYPKKNEKNYAKASIKDATSLINRAPG